MTRNTFAKHARKAPAPPAPGTRGVLRSTVMAALARIEAALAELLEQVRLGRRVTPAGHPLLLGLGVVCQQRPANLLWAAIRVNHDDTADLGHAEIHGSASAD